MDALELFIKARVAYEGFVPEMYGTQEELKEAQKRTEQALRALYDPVKGEFLEESLNHQFHMFCAGLEARP